MDLRVKLIDPYGTELDVSDRLEDSDLDAIIESSEEELLELNHGDASLTLDDGDGAISRFLGQLTPDVRYECVIERETLRRRPKYERVFGGTLDLPQSVNIHHDKFDAGKRRVELQVFGFTKLLEAASASDIKRTVEDRVGSVDIVGHANLVYDTDTTDIVPGDEIELSNNTRAETRTVGTIVSATKLRVTEDFNHTYIGADLELKTPYYRNKTIAFLAAQVFQAANIADFLIEPGRALAAYPVATDINRDDLPLIAHPKSIVQQTVSSIPLITITYPFDTIATRKTSAGPTQGFGDGVTTNVTQYDWRPYLLAEPATIRELANRAADDGSVAWAYVAGDYHELREVIGGAFDSEVFLDKNGTQQTSIDTYSDATMSGYTSKFVEHEPINNKIWISVGKRNGPAGAFDGVKIWKDATLTTLIEGNGERGPLRMIRQLGRMFQSCANGQVRLWDVTTQTIALSVGDQPELQAWTARLIGQHICVIYRKSGTGRLRIYDYRTLGVVADYEISNRKQPNQFSFLTLFEDGSDEGVGIGWYGRRYFALSRQFAGVIPYADFGDRSCAAALKDLALASASIISVNHYKSGALRSRTFLDPLRPRHAMPIPLSRSTHPLWEFYRNSVEVTGKAPDGDEVRAIVGETGDSAHRIGLSSSMISTESIAQAIGAIYLRFLSRLRVQEDIEIEDLGTQELVSFLDHADLDSAQHIVLESERDLSGRKSRLRLASFTDDDLGDGFLPISPERIKPPEIVPCIQGNEITQNGSLEIWDYNGGFPKYWNVTGGTIQAPGEPLGYCLSLPNATNVGRVGHVTGALAAARPWTIAAWMTLKKYRNYHLGFRLKADGADSARTFIISIFAFNAASVTDSPQPTGLDADPDSEDGSVTSFDVGGAGWAQPPTGDLVIHNIPLDGVWRSYTIQFSTASMPAGITADPFYFEMDFFRGAGNFRAFIDDISVTECLPAPGAVTLGAEKFTDNSIEIWFTSYSPRQHRSTAPFTQQQWGGRVGLGCKFVQTQGRINCGSAQDGSGTFWIQLVHGTVYTMTFWALIEAGDPFDSGIAMIQPQGKVGSNWYSRQGSGTWSAGGNLGSQVGTPSFIPLFNDNNWHQMSFVFTFEPTGGTTGVSYDALVLLGRQANGEPPFVVDDLSLRPHV